LYDRTLAHKLTLRNLLQREGYESVAQILEKGLEKGREEGLEKGREEGLEKGREAMAETLLALLRARGLPVDDVTVGRVRGCRENEQLRTWMVRAGTAATVDQVFAETEQA
jgi:predicted transposase YdaD